MHAEGAPTRGARYPAKTVTALTRSFRTIHGYQRAFIRAGSGPALLLIHGIGDDADSWADVIPALAKDFTVIERPLTNRLESQTVFAAGDEGRMICSQCEVVTSVKDTQ